MQRIFARAAGIASLIREKFAAEFTGLILILWPFFIAPLLLLEFALLGITLLQTADIYFNLEHARLPLIRKHEYAVIPGRVHHRADIRLRPSASSPLSRPLKYKLLRVSVFRTAIRGSKHTPSSAPTPSPNATVFYILSRICEWGAPRSRLYLKISAALT